MIFIYNLRSRQKKKGGSVKVNDLVDKIQKYSEDADIRMIVDAYLYSAQSHTGQNVKVERHISHIL